MWIGADWQLQALPSAKNSGYFLDLLPTSPQRAWSGWVSYLCLAEVSGKDWGSWWEADSSQRPRIIRQASAPWVVSMSRREGRGERRKTNAWAPMSTMFYDYTWVFKSGQNYFSASFHCQEERWCYFQLANRPKQLILNSKFGFAYVMNWLRLFRDTTGTLYAGNQ